MTDVQTLILALTADRDGLDRAIAALRAISKPVPTPAAFVAPKPRTAKKTRAHISDATKREVVARMQASTIPPWRQALVVARDLGLNVGSVRAGWKIWQRQFGPQSETTNHAAAQVQ